MEISGDIKTFSKYVSLNVMGMIGLSAYILADTLFVANGIGEIGIAALNIALPIFTVITGLGLLLGMGGATWYTILKAKNKQAEATKAFNHSVILATIISIITVLIGLFGSESIARLLGANGETYTMTHIYLKVILLFSPFFIFNNMLVAFVRNDQNPKLAMASMLIGTLANIVFDYIFIFTLQLGMFGAALATSIAPILGLILLSFHFRTEQNSLTFKKITIKVRSFWRIISLGISSFITEVSTGIVMLIFNILILGISNNIGVAAYGIIANIAMIVIAMFTGIAQGIQPIISHLFGLRKISKMNRNMVYGFVTSVTLSIAIYAFIWFRSDLLISLFNKDNNPLLAEIANTGLTIYFIGMFFAGFNIIAIASLSAIEQAHLAFKFSIIRSTVLIIPISLVLSYFFGMVGVWSSFVVTEAITSGLVIWQLYRIGQRENIQHA